MVILRAGNVDLNPATITLGVVAKSWIRTPRLLLGVGCRRGLSCRRLTTGLIPLASAHHRHPVVKKRAFNGYLVRPQDRIKPALHWTHLQQHAFGIPSAIFVAVISVILAIVIKRTL
jgi:hypothetical protein